MKPKHSLDEHPIKQFSDWRQIMNDVQYCRISWPVIREAPMEDGRFILCPKCGRTIEDFSLSDDEWCCECGESGILEFEEYEEDDE